MKNYLKADFGRIIRSLKRWILMLLTFGALAAILYFVAYDTEEITTVQYVNSAESMLSGMILIMSLIDYMCIIGDDFKAKTMQVAIGRGVSRMQVVWSKIIMFSLYMAVDILILTAIAIGVSSLFVLTLSGTQVVEMFLYAYLRGFILLGYVIFSLPIAFYTQNSALGFFAYATFSFGFVTNIVQLALSMTPVIKEMNLQEFFYSTYTSAFQSRVLVGVFEPIYLGAILLWLVVLLLITWILFRKKELEF